MPYYLRLPVYSTAIGHGTQEDFDFLFAKWKAEHYMLEKERIFAGLCSTDSRENSDVLVVISLSSLQFLTSRAWLALLQNRARENMRLRAISCSKKVTRQALLVDFLFDRPDLVNEL